LGYEDDAIATGVEEAIETVNLRGLEEYPPLALSSYNMYVSGASPPLI